MLLVSVTNIKTKSNSVPTLKTNKNKVPPSECGFIFLIIFVIFYNLLQLATERATKYEWLNEFSKFNIFFNISGRFDI